MITYIVITENHNWGKGTRLKEALHNARLRHYSIEDWFCDYIEKVTEELGSIKGSVSRAWADWFYYGEGEREESVKFVLYFFDDEVWEDFEVSEFNGSVAFWPRGGARTQQRKC